MEATAGAETTVLMCMPGGEEEDDVSSGHLHCFRITPAVKKWIQDIATQAEVSDCGLERRHRRH